MRAFGPGSVSSFLKTVLDVVVYALWAAGGLAAAAFVLALLAQPFLGPAGSPARFGDDLDRILRRGPALLMLPGTLGTAAIFAPTLQALGARIRIVSVTYPMVADIARLADGLAALMDHLALARASVAGSSLGGFLAQHFAARHPGRVQQLLLGNTLWDPGLTRSLVGPRSLEALRALPAAGHRDIVLGSVRSWPEDTAAQRSLKALLLHSGPLHVIGASDAIKDLPGSRTAMEWPPTEGLAIALRTRMAAGPADDARSLVPAYVANPIITTPRDSRVLPKG